jgi:hypothetical protein
LAGGVPRHGVVVEGVKGGKKAPMPAGIQKNSTGHGQFPVLIDFIIIKNAVFHSKVLNTIYFQDVF